MAKHTDPSARRQAVSGRDVPVIVKRRSCRTATVHAHASPEGLTAITIIVPHDQPASKQHAAFLYRALESLRQEHPADFQ